MKVKIELEIAPLKVPDHVSVMGNAGLKQAGFEKSRQLHVSELDSGTLNGLCNVFREELFAKAMKNPGVNPYPQATKSAPVIDHVAVGRADRAIQSLINDIKQYPWLLTEPVLQPLFKELSEKLK